MTKKLLLLLLTASLRFAAQAQMPDDGFTMNKGELCLVAAYKQVSWKEYWEGDRLRDNKNLGTFTSRMYMPMAGYGVTDKLNLFASLPYISNTSSAGYLMPQKGWQDVSVAAKYRFLQTGKRNMQLSLFATIGASLPASKYVPDFLPFSIGLQSKTASARLVTHLRYRSDWFATLQWGYTLRDNITVDRQTYYTDGQYYSNEMFIPNQWDGGAKIGFANSRLRAYAMYNMMRTVSGSDIRRNDMPYPGNKMDMTSAGVHLLYWVPQIKGLGINASAEQVLTGRNVGKAFMWMAGLQYVFTPFHKHHNCTNQSCTK
jgi:hypothetical protein